MAAVARAAGAGLVLFGWPAAGRPCPRAQLGEMEPVAAGQQTGWVPAGIVKLVDRFDKRVVV